MREVTITTNVGKLPYPLTYREFDSCSEAAGQIGGVDESDIAIEWPEAVEKAVCGVINAAQKQGAAQGGKEMIRDAAREAEFSLEQDGLTLEDCPEEVQQAVESHQSRALKYVIGAPRGARGGLTKTRVREIGVKVFEKMGDEAFLAWAREQGIDPAELGVTAGNEE